MADKVEAATQTMIANLAEKTGKSLAEWVEIVKKAGPHKHGEIVKMLKTDHAMGHGYANLVAHASKGAVGEEAPAEDDLVATQYAGDKAVLKPIYDKLLAIVKKFGPDVEISPKKANVSIRRSKQFALIQPTTKTRMDLGINLKGIAPTARLEVSGSFNSMVSHRVRIESVDMIDAELIAWLKQAYDAA